MAKRTKTLLQTETESAKEGVRLNKFLSDAGVCSRREGDTLIAAGQVTVDGEKALVGTRVLPGQKVAVKGKVVGREEKLVLIALNKPRGIVCTTDLREKQNVISFVDYKSRIFPIGRLDKESEGLLLLTNDGDIVNKILRAGNHHEKEYIVTVNKMITDDFIKGMSNGVIIEDGNSGKKVMTRKCVVTKVDKNSFKIILTQGYNRQIRRMCEFFGYKVRTLKRLRIMNIQLGRLKTGQWRNITDQELAGLKKLIADSSKTANK